MFTKPCKPCNRASRSAARALGIKPHELQAITWTVWRRQHSHHGRNADARHSVHVFEDIF